MELPPILFTYCYVLLPKKNKMRSSKEIEKEYWDKLKEIGKFDHPELSKLRKELKCAESNCT